MSSSSSSSPAKGSHILVTGAGGYVGSAIVDQLLKEGFKVRATTRTSSKLDLLKQKVDKQFGQGKFEVVEIADLSVKGALDEALKGVEGVINVASDTSFGENLEQIVGSVVSLNKEVLSSVKAAGGVKSFVSTSSRIAAFAAGGTKVDHDTWFDEAYSLAEKSPNPFLIYASSKVAGEKAVWNFVENEKPDFRVNAVLPDLVLGRIHNPAKGFYSTASGLISFADGDSQMMDMIFPNPGYFIDVEDLAELHVAVLLDESVDKQRVWGAAAPWTATKIQEAVKSARPDFQEKDVSNFPDLPDLPVDTKAFTDLLQKHYGHGLRSLNDSVKETLA